MKRTGLLHPDLSQVVASLGHGDTLVIADAGLPIPGGVRRIDLAFWPGKPSFLDALEAVLAEMQVESAVLAEEFREVPPAGFREAVLGRLGPLGNIGFVPHATFKQATRDARAVVRTGEFTPYANVILVSGVVF